MSVRRKRILLLSYLAAAFLVLAGFTWRSSREAEISRRGQQYDHRRALMDLADSVGDMELSLRKTLCAGTPSMAAACCADVYARSLMAQAALSELPSNGAGLEQTASFVAKTGDYALSLARSAARGALPAQADLSNLSSLRDTAAELSGSLTALYADVSAGEVSLSELTEDDAGKDLAGSLGDLETEFPSLPTLIYDGPFSDALENDTAVALQGLPEVTAESALAEAIRFSGTDALAYVGEREREIPVYVFSADDDGHAITVEVTRQGGRVILLRSNEQVGEAALTAVEAAGIASDLLYGWGYTDMQESYHMTEGGSCVISFAWAQDGVLCYSDLVKVTVSLETGRVTGFDASGYLMHHGHRSIPAAVISPQDARALLSPWLTPESENLAVIPIEGGRELFCHELVCQGQDGGHYLVYVNALTGEEEQILILLESESGTLTR